MVARLWEIGQLAAVVVFGVKIGLALGFSGLRPRVSLALMAGYGLVLYALALLAARHTGALYALATRYNYVLFLAMAAVILWAGLHVLREWECCGRDAARWGWVALAAPCPCCFGAVLLAVVLAAPVLEVSVGVLGRYTSVTLVASGCVTYLLADRITRLLRRPYPVLLGHLMLLAGFYFLASALVIPQMACLDRVRFAPLVVPPPGIMAGLGAGAAALLGLGAWAGHRRGLLR